MAVRDLSRLQLRRLRPLDLVNLLAIAVTVLAGLFILTGSAPVLFVLPVVAALGLDGVLRGHPLGKLRSSAAIAEQLLLPAAFVVAAALFFRYVSVSYWSLLAALGTGIAFALVCYAEYATLDLDDAHALPRTVLLVAAFAGLYGLLAAFYAYDLGAPAAALLCGVAGAVFAFELYRETELSAADRALYTLVSGFMLAQVRWALQFLRLDGLLAAMFLLLVFYLITGLSLAAVARRMDRRVGAEYSIVAIAGLAVIVVARLLVAG
ncbi:MAG TPA: hypothetical protein VFD32_19935 [Dehalococcoidia bacterium]|nr:hypothetical protein [Dehalococcoidia bacterium]